MQPLQRGAARRRGRRRPVPGQRPRAQITGIVVPIDGGTSAGPPVTQLRDLMRGVKAAKEQAAAREQEANDEHRRRHPGWHRRRRHRYRTRRADVAVSDGRITQIAPGSTATASSRPTGASSHPASSTSTRTTTRRCSGSGAAAVVVARRHHGRRRQLRLHHRPHPARAPRRDRAHARERRGHGRRSLTEGIVWDFLTYPQYLELVRARGTVINFTAYVGHSSVRLFVMGDDAYEHAATPEEIAEMCALVVEAIEAGAAGFSTSFAYTHRGMDGKPGQPLRGTRRGRGAVPRRRQHRQGRGARDRGRAVHLRRHVRVPAADRAAVHLSPVRAGERPPPSAARAARRSGRPRRAGVAAGDAPPLTMQFTMDSPFSLNVSSVFGGLMDGDRDARLAAYADPEWRARAAADLAEQPMKPRWETCEVSESDRFPELEGRRVDELARERGVGPLDVICELRWRGPAHPVPHLHRQRRRRTVDAC